MGRDEPVGPPRSSWADSGWVGAEPDDDLERTLAATEEPFDERQPHVMTALGPVEPAALGATLFADWDRPLTGAGLAPGAVLRELEQAYAAGVRTIVALASASATSDDFADLFWISARTPVHIIVAAEPAKRPKASGGEPVRVVAAIANVARAGRAMECPAELPVFKRAGVTRGVEHAGAPVTSNVEVGVAWVILAETALTADPERAHEFDGMAGLVVLVATERLKRMSRAAETVRELVIERGFGDRLALGYTSNPVGFMERFPVLLMEAGLPAAAVRRLLVENPARALTRRPQPDG